MLVLGYRSRRGDRLHPVQRWRTEVGVRSLAAGGRLVLSGGPTGDGRSEAAVMAEHALALGVPASAVVLEEGSRSTWDNVALSLPLLEDADVIRIASDPLHAARARAYLVRQRPDLARRLAPADDCRLLEQAPMKVVTAAYEVARRRRPR
ncbi:YdcF family protein [Motilibacter rhizosphaerae]|uniref:YdcF family protein n=1 Tax=Motilibacter rhizosphaerae TaxID=598652 RepID=UPI001E57D002|nr:YdcF family protein [Motilibacter rhizosphaerae]